MTLVRQPWGTVAALVRVDGERGSGVVVGVALLGVVAAALAMVLALASGLTARQRTIGAADAAALAAADAASGAVPGVPCELANRVASADGATVESCRLDGLVAQVAVAADVLGVRVRASARAGPPLEHSVPLVGAGAPAKGSDSG